mgnify:CR=1 FL=1
MTPQERAKQLALLNDLAGSMGQTVVCMALMIANSVLWCCRKKFSRVWHSVHFFVAVAVLIVYLPRRNWWPAMSD